MNTKKNGTLSKRQKGRGAVLVEVLMATFIFISSSAFLFTAFNKSSALLAVIQNHQQRNLASQMQKMRAFTTAAYEQQWNDITKLGALTLEGTSTFANKTNNIR
jgi:hypothetical protein